LRFALGAIPEILAVFPFAFADIGFSVNAK